MKFTEFIMSMEDFSTLLFVTQLIEWLPGVKIHNESAGDNGTTKAG